MNTKSIQQHIVTSKPAPVQASKVDVNVKIDSQTLATVEKVKSTGIADVQLDVGNFATAY